MQNAFIAGDLTVGGEMEINRITLADSINPAGNRSDEANYGVAIRNTAVAGESGISFSVTPTSTDNIGAAITHERTDTYSKGNLKFYTKRANTNGTDPVLAMTLTDAGQVLIDGFAAAAVGVVIKAAAAQTANLTNWEASDGTALLEVEAGGVMDYRWAMGNSALDPTTDAPADWVQVKIGGTSYYLPAYAAS